MTIVQMRPSRPAREARLSDLWAPEKDAGRMYAIAFDLNTDALERSYPSDNWRNAYDDIARELKAHGFERQQGSVYFGRRGTTPVHCVIATQALAKRYSWFAKSVRDMRMLRIEENNDLMPAIGQLHLPLAPPSAANA